MFRSMARGYRGVSRAGNRMVGATAPRGMRAARRGVNAALPTGSRRRSLALGSTVGGRRARAGAAIGVGGLLGANAVVGPRGKTSGSSGLQGRSVGGGRGF